jgi:hypothetical protein
VRRRFFFSSGRSRRDAPFTESSPKKRKKGVREENVLRRFKTAALSTNQRKGAEPRRASRLDGKKQDAHLKKSRRRRNFFGLGLDPKIGKKLKLLEIEVVIETELIINARRTFAVRY